MKRRYLHTSLAVETAPRSRGSINHAAAPVAGANAPLRRTAVSGVTISQESSVDHILSSVMFSMRVKCHAPPAMIAAMTAADMPRAPQSA
jgi:hypothetical protein